MKQSKQSLQIISKHKHNAFIFQLNQFLCETLKQASVEWMRIEKVENQLTYLGLKKKKWKREEENDAAWDWLWKRIVSHCID